MDRLSSAGTNRKPLARSVGRFEEVVETQDNDVVGVGDRTIVYALRGDDRLRAKPEPLLGIQSTAGLVGGSGDDTYQAASQGVTIIMDAGTNRDVDFLIAPNVGISRQSTFIADIDDRHLLAGDVVSGQVVLLIDWKDPKNRIEKARLSDGEFNYEDVAPIYKTLGNYIGNFSWQAAGEELLNLKRVGISPGNVNRAIRKIAKRARRLEKSIDDTSFNNVITSGSRTPLNEKSPLTSTFSTSEPIVPSHPLQKID